MKIQRKILVKGKGGGETINLEKQFVKGLQNLGKSVMLVMDGTYNFILINIHIMNITLHA